MSRSRELILASSSPRRRELLHTAGFDFRIDPPDVDETANAGESAEELAQRLAREKALFVAKRSEAGACVLAADTLVVVDSLVLGKPRDPVEAVAMLRRIQGRKHRVVTAFALCLRAENALEVGSEISEVSMHPVELEVARAYAASGEPLDKAGAYALQGEGARFVSEVIGSRSNVIGLPLERVVPLLARYGVVPR